LQVFLCAAAFGVHGTQHDARASVTLLGGFLEPGEGRAFFARQAFAAQIQVGKIVLGLRVAVFCGLALPEAGLRTVFGDAETLIVEIAKIHLRSRVASVRALLKLAECFVVIPMHATAVHVQDA